MIEIKNLTKKFEEKVIFDKFNLEIKNKDFIIFSGPSGCGKTTLLNMIGAIEPFEEGHILVDGANINNPRERLNYFRTKIGFLFQNFALVDNKTVRENLKLIHKYSRTNISIESALQTVGLQNKLNKKVYTLSGGEQQRVALARLMLKKCDIILADEPTGSLDSTNAEIVINILKELNKKGKTIILVTHDENIKKQGNRTVYL